MACAFKNPFALLPMILGILILWFIVSFGLLLDFIFFPKIRKQKIEKPIIIIGNPRSGTTFLQRFLVEQNVGVGTELWKMLFPSLTLQKLIKPILPIIEKISPARYHQYAAHKTNLTAIETDDPSLLFRFFDGFFVYGFFLAFAKEDLKKQFAPEYKDTSKRDFSWLEKVWKRNLLSEKSNQLIAKMFSLSVRVSKYLEYFPDAKIIYTIRDPMETVPSGLSLVTGVLDGKFGFWTRLENKKRNEYIERLYNGLLDLSIRFHISYANTEFPPEKVKIVPYQRMMNDFEAIMNEIFEFIDIKPTNDTLENIKVTAEKQKKFKSEHKYDLQKFGLNEERIKQDYELIYKTFF